MPSPSWALRPDTRQKTLRNPIKIALFKSFIILKLGTVDHHQMETICPLIKYLMWVAVDFGVED